MRDDLVMTLGIVSIAIVSFGGFLLYGVSVDTLREAFDALSVIVLSTFVLLSMRLVPKALGREMPTTLMAAVVIALLLHAMGVHLRMYQSLEGMWDVVTHLTSSVVVALIGCRIIEEASLLSGKRMPVRLLFLGTIAFAAMAGIVWEFAELACDELIGTGMQYAKYMDTNIDLLADLVGGLIAAVSTVVVTGQERTSNVIVARE